jgi:hypothetical protein
MKNEGLLIMLYEIHGEHRHTWPPLERNYTTLILPMGHINNLLPKWWVTHSSPNRHPILNGRFLSIIILIEKGCSHSFFLQRESHG